MKILLTLFYIGVEQTTLELPLGYTLNDCIRIGEAYIAEIAKRGWEGKVLKDGELVVMCIEVPPMPPELKQG